MHYEFTVGVSRLAFPISQTSLLSGAENVLKTVLKASNAFGRCHLHEQHTAALLSDFILLVTFFTQALTETAIIKTSRLAFKDS